MSQRVTVEFENQLARVCLNRPDKHNALDLEMFQEIDRMQKKLAANRDLRAVILHGAGVDFCTGLDIKSVMRDRSAMRKLLWKWLPWRANLAQRVSVNWRRMPAPVIIAIHGRCWGGGMQIALGGDFRIVHPQASLSVMESRWGLVPDMGGSLGLRELMPCDQATLLSMTAEPFSGEKAMQLGLATRLADDPLASATQLATELTERSPDAVAGVKRLYRKNWNGSAGAALARESGYQVKILTGANQRIAVKRQMGEQVEYKSARKW